MIPNIKSCYAVCTRAGKLLALIPKQTLTTSDGLELGWRPIAERSQVVVEVELTAEHFDCPLHDLIDRYDVDLNRRRGGARLKRRIQRNGRKPNRAK